MLIFMNSYRNYSLLFFSVHVYSFALLFDRTESFGHSTSPISYSDAPTVFSVWSYGAVGDGVSDDTDAFRKCWEAACSSLTSAIFHVPENHRFMIQYIKFSGPCMNQLFFQIQGHILAPSGPGRWLASQRLYWLVFEGIDGMTVEGRGVIDGRGTKWWNLPCKPHKGPGGSTLPGRCDSPIAMVFVLCSNLIVHELRIKNSPLFHIWLEGCDGVRIDSLIIISPAESPNTDGIHLHRTKNVKISHSLIANGDDCVSIGGGSYNVDMSNLTCGPGHGISIGSLGMRNKRECVSKITVRDSIIKQSDNGLRIKTWQGGSGSVSSVIYDNIHMDNVRNPIIISQYYCDKSYACPNRSSAVYITDILYKNIVGTYNATRPPVYLACSDSVPCTNLSLQNVKLKPAVMLRKKTNPFCWKAHGVARDTIPSVDCLTNDHLPLPEIGKC